MTQQQILEYSLKKRGAFICYPFGPDVTIVKVKAPSFEQTRIFVQLSVRKNVPFATFNCDAATGMFYRSIFPNAVTRGYHCPPVMQPYFNTVELNGDVPDDEILHMIDHSYAVVVAKLPKSVQNELK